MIDLLLQLAYVALVLAVISVFICTLPMWLIVGRRTFAAVIGSSPKETIGHNSDAKRQIS
jgi:hypothetical protein